MHSISRLTAASFADRRPELAALLADVVADGASLGFVAPFDRGAAAAWWRARQAEVAAGGLTVWIADGPDGAAGTVSLLRSAKANGRHRAEIVKLMVHPGARGRGLARALLATAEREAVRAGVELLLLDTESGSPAERLYHSAGWTRFGTVPDYAADPAGVLKDCVFFYKLLQADGLNARSKDGTTSSRSVHGPRPTDG